MRTILKAALLAALALMTAAAAHADRIVSIGGDVTEIVYALGQGKRIVGVDQTSMHPKEAMALPQVGYLRNLSAEGILSLKPDLIVAGAHAGPPAVLEQLKDAKIRIALIPGEESIPGVLAKVDAVAAALGVPMSRRRASIFRIRASCSRARRISLPKAEPCSPSCTT